MEITWPFPRNSVHEVRGLFQQELGEIGRKGPAWVECVAIPTRVVEVKELEIEMANRIVGPIVGQEAPGLDRHLFLGAKLVLRRCFAQRSVRQRAPQKVRQSGRHLVGRWARQRGCYFGRRFYAVQELWRLQ